MSVFSRSAGVSSKIAVMETSVLYSGSEDLLKNIRHVVHLEFVGFHIGNSKELRLHRESRRSFTSFLICSVFPPSARWVLQIFDVHLAVKGWAVNIVPSRFPEALSAALFGHSSSCNSEPKA